MNETNLTNITFSREKRTRAENLYLWRLNYDEKPRANNWQSD